MLENTTPQHHRQCSHEEFERLLGMFMKEKAWQNERVTFLLLIKAGLQPDEAFRIDRVIAQDAVNVSRLTVPGRSVPVDERLKIYLKKLIEIDDDRTYLLVPKGHSVERVMRHFLVCVEYHGFWIVPDLYDGSLTVESLHPAGAVGLPCGQGP